MQVPPPPPNAAAGVAGTARAQGRGTDAETTAKQTTDRKRTTNPGAKAPEADILSLAAGAETDDRDANGNAGYGPTGEGTAEPEEEQVDTAESGPPPVSEGNGHIDFQA